MASAVPSTIRFATGNKKKLEEVLMAVRLFVSLSSSECINNNDAFHWCTVAPQLCSSVAGD